MKVGAVDIGTNSVRLLITDGEVEFRRSDEVTGLGRGVDSAGRLSVEAVVETISALERYGEAMDSHGVESRRAVATAAARDAENREEFFDLAEVALGVRPVLVSGREEARLAYEGATAELEESEPWLVTDIGGGSTEFVTILSEVSVDIGSVRLTERQLAGRPPRPGDLTSSRSELRRLFSSVDLGRSRALVGVAGTWTSLAAIALGLPIYDATIVHRSVLSAGQISETLERLSGLTLEQTASIPSLDPKRAPVILAGSVIAEAVMESLESDSVLISQADSLDGVVRQMLALP